MGVVGSNPMPSTRVSLVHSGHMGNTSFLRHRYVSAPTEAACLYALDVRREQPDESTALRDFVGSGSETGWLGGRDSNPDTQIQSLQSYH